MATILHMTERDRALLKRLHDYGLMTTRQIERAAFPGVGSSTVLRRLRKLEKMRLIEKENGLCGGPLIWAVPSALVRHSRGLNLR